MTEKSRNRLAITEAMTIYEAQSQKGELMSMLSSSETLELDLSAVAEIDTAGLQLLLLLKREAARQGKRLILADHSVAVQQALDFCNLAAVFGDPMLIPAQA